MSEFSFKLKPSRNNGVLIVKIFGVIGEINALIPVSKPMRSHACAMGVPPRDLWKPELASEAGIFVRILTDNPAYQPMVPQRTISATLFPVTNSYYIQEQEKSENNQLKRPENPWILIQRRSGCARRGIKRFAIFNRSPEG
jgi:hypothetical protein